MKLKIIIDENRDEEIIVYSHGKNRITQEIERLVSSSATEIAGYRNSDVFIIDYSDIYCFVCESDKVYAVTEKEKYRIKSRLYKVEETLGKDFVKINQSCVANVKKIRRFEASPYGSLTVIFKNGYKDYVSRRQIKKVKERLGL